MTETEIRKLARQRVREIGPDKTAALFGVGRQTALSMAAGAYVRPSTFAGVRERLAAQAAAEQGQEPATKAD